MKTSQTAVVQSSDIAATLIGQGAPATAEPVLSTGTLRAIERAHVRDGLMERAGDAATRWAIELCSRPDRPVLIVAGPGNNGGDALVVARLLRQRFFDVRLVMAGDPASLPDDARQAHARLNGLDIPILSAIPDIPFSLIIDGLFGIGLRRPVDGVHADLIRGMNQTAGYSACPLLALDCPSGLDSETGCSLGATVRATHTITFIAHKAGLLTGDGPEICGTLRVDTLGLANESTGNDGETIGLDNIATALHPRPRNSHKGSFGAVGILGGAPGMLGAALLAGRAALHVGAGRVYLGLIDAQAPGVDPQQPELMLRTAAALFAAPLTFIAAGPGMGTGDTARDLLATAIRQALPLLLDADAINLVAADPTLRQSVGQRSASKRITVLTPHPAEAARLLGTNVDNLQKNRIDAARRIASEFSAWVVLKGDGSIVASPEGRWWINTSGNPALATAGSGDVLTGLLAGLLAQDIDPGAAVRCAVHLHGAAADAFAAEIGGEIGLAAAELIPIARRQFNLWVRR